jgi:tripeptidyl-peptidase-1
MSLRCLLLAVISACAVGASTARPQLQYAVVERNEAPQQWKRLGPAPKEKMFQMKIGLEQSGFDDLERELYQGETPRFP